MAIFHFEISKGGPKITKENSQYKELEMKVIFV